MLVWIIMKEEVSPGIAVLLPNVLLHCTSFDLFGTMRTRHLLGVAVHSLAVIVQTACKLERHTAIITVSCSTLVALLSLSDDVPDIKLLLHGCKVWKLVK